MTKICTNVHEHNVMATYDKQRYSSVTLSASSLDAGRCYMLMPFTPEERIHGMQWTESLGVCRAGLDVVAEKTISAFTRKQTPSHLVIILLTEPF